MDFKDILLAASLLSTGLMAGLLYGWSVSVIPGLRRTTDLAYVGTMQHINRAIINPAFVIPFMGVPIVLGAAAVAQFRAGDARRGWLLAGATASYVVGVLGVTIGRNIPLNDALDTFRVDERDAGAMEVRRETYERPWNHWHYLRTFGSVGAFTLAVTAALVAADAA